MMLYRGAARRLPGFLRRYVFDFEARIEDAVRNFAAALPAGARVLDAGAGECRHAPFFARQRYCGVDLAIGDTHWDYGRLDAVADLARLPFRPGTFDAFLSVVTLEHVTGPARAVAELGACLKPGGTALVVVPQDWEVHQAPHDYFRVTRHGLALLVAQAGLEVVRIEAAGGIFRLLSRRLFNALQFFPGPLFAVAALLLVPPALVLPWFDRLDRERNFTLGYLCTARKPF
ncbi:MAG: class I SAM-dependent methyltransferase [Acidobacteria bacterium]|nr:class I SAM-dependent methyltransferase [Acidobacteriota bacterium]